MMDWSAAGWIMMGLGMVLFWALVILGIVWIVRTFAGEQREPKERNDAHERSAIETLDRSLAEGTVDVEDYEERRRILTRSR